jgi:hypothetical protein
LIVHDINHNYDVKFLHHMYIHNTIFDRNCLNLDFTKRKFWLQKSISFATSDNNFLAIHYLIFSLVACQLSCRIQRSV